MRIEVMKAFLLNALIILLVLLPAGGLLWKWRALPAQVPLHFSGSGNRYGDKHLLLVLVLLPLGLYLALPRLARRNTRAGSYHAVATGAVLALSFVLTALVLASGAAN